jgi:hypothetical protein
MMIQLFSRNDEMSIFVNMCITDLSAISQDRNISKQGLILNVKVPKTCVYSVLIKAVYEEEKRNIGTYACTHFHMFVCLFL